IWLDGDRVGRSALSNHRAACAVDRSEKLIREVISREEACDLPISVIGDQDRAEQPLLCLDHIRKRRFDLASYGVHSAASMRVKADLAIAMRRSRNGSGVA